MSDCYYDVYLVFYYHKTKFLKAFLEPGAPFIKRTSLWCASLMKQVPGLWEVEIYLTLSNSFPLSRVSQEGFLRSARMGMYPWTTKMVPRVLLYASLKICIWFFIYRDFFCALSRDVIYHIYAWFVTHINLKSWKAQWPSLPLDPRHFRRLEPSPAGLTADSPIVFPSWN